MGIRELFQGDPMRPEWPCPPSRRWFSWTNFFLGVDQVVKLWERWCPRWIRQAAIERADCWMQEHFDDSDGVGAIFPPIVYTIICLKCLGYDEQHEKFRWAMKQLEDLFLEDDDTLRVQPCFSPVWDTALSLNALAMSNDGDSQDAMVDASPALGRSRGPAARRLEPAQSRSAAGRLVLRVQERLLPRYRRHCHGTDGTGPQRLRAWDRTGLG